MPLGVRAKKRKMASRPFEIHRRAIEAAEAVPATTWLEAAEAILDQQEGPHRQALGGGSLDRSEARKHIKAIQKIRAVLRAEPGLSKKRGAMERTDDTNVRAMRRRDLLCPKGWREGIRKKLQDAADASEQLYLDADGLASSFDDQHCVDAQALRLFITELDWVETRGQNAAQAYARKAVNG